MATKSANAKSAVAKPLSEEKLAKVYSAEYLGGGTFIISKPKRKPRKLNQSRVKSPQRGARK